MFRSLQGGQCILCTRRALVILVPNFRLLVRAFRNTAYGLYTDKAPTRRQLSLLLDHLFLEFATPSSGLRKHLVPGRPTGEPNRRAPSRSAWDALAKGTGLRDAGVPESAGFQS